MKQKQTRASGGGAPRPTQGNWINSRGPNYRRVGVQSGYTGGMTDSASNYFGGNAGMGNTYSDAVGSFLSVLIGRMIAMQYNIDETPMIAESIGLIPKISSSSVTTLHINLGTNSWSSFLKPNINNPFFKAIRP